VSWRGCSLEGSSSSSRWRYWRPQTRLARRFLTLSSGHRFAEYYGEAGESNELEITYQARTMTMTDAGSLIAGGSGCAQVSNHEVTCSPVDQAAFFLADRNDKAALLGVVTLKVFGGTEDDVLTLCRASRGRRRRVRRRYSCRRRRRSSIFGTIGTTASWPYTCR
jgi:hypothetical protein